MDLTTLTTDELTALLAERRAASDAASKAYAAAGYRDRTAMDAALMSWGEAYDEQTYRRIAAELGVLKLEPRRTEAGELFSIHAAINLRPMTEAEAAWATRHDVANEWLREHGAPKSLGAKGTTLSAGRRTYARVGWSAKLRADGSNGGRNETGIARLAALLRWAEKAGVPVQGDGAALLAEARA